MKKAFSLLEIIFVIVVISIISSFLVNKYNSSISTTTKIGVKADIALINSAIRKKNSQKLLLNESKITFLDKASINQKSTTLFDNILDIPKISTNENEKELGKWIKTSNYKYKVYIEKNQYIEYQFTNDSFKCISSLELCKEYE